MSNSDRKSILICHSSLFNTCLVKNNVICLRVNESLDDTSFRVKIFASTLCARPTSGSGHTQWRQCIAALIYGPGEAVLLADIGQCSCQTTSDLSRARPFVHSPTLMGSAQYLEQIHNGEGTKHNFRGQRARGVPVIVKLKAARVWCVCVCVRVCANHTASIAAAWQQGCSSIYRPETCTDQEWVTMHKGTTQQINNTFFMNHTRNQSFRLVNGHEPVMNQKVWLMQIKRHFG